MKENYIFCINYVFEKRREKWLEEGCSREWGGCWVYKLIGTY